MIRITRMTDYAIVLLGHFARNADSTIHSAKELAAEAELPLPTVNKVLKTLARQGLLDSHRGAKGGYSLARQPDEISVADVIRATEGPVAMTECTVEREGNCSHEAGCPVSGNWQRINHAIQQALERISLSEMIHPIEGCPSDGSSLVTMQGLGPS
jgi:FeS assembly SUF system regulator